MKKQASKWLVFLNIPFQMGVIIFLGVFIGKYLDEKTGYEPTFIIVFSLLSIGLALYNVLKKVKDIQNKKDD